jgi:hypothetical protein
MLKKYENGVQRQSAYRLRKRLRTLDNPCGRLLFQAYLLHGLDASVQSLLPEISLDEVCALGDPWLVRPQFVKELVLSSPYIELRRSEKPTVRLCATINKKTREARLAELLAFQDQFQRALEEIKQITNECVGVAS